MKWFRYLTLYGMSAFLCPFVAKYPPFNTPEREPYLLFWLFTAGIALILTCPVGWMLLFIKDD